MARGVEVAYQADVVMAEIRELEQEWKKYE